MSEIALQQVKRVPFEGSKFAVLGFGTIARGILPLVFRHVDVRPDQVIIFTRPEDKQHVEKAVDKYGVSAVYGTITKNVKAVEELLSQLDLQEGDFMLNLLACVDANLLMRYAMERQILYMDTTTDVFDDEDSDVEEEEDDEEEDEDDDEEKKDDGDVEDDEFECEWGPGMKENWFGSTYVMRETLLAIQEEFGPNTSTALSSHGANPGMVSHFVKQALVNMAKDYATDDAPFNMPSTREEWADLAMQLNIKTIQVSEYDSQYRNQRKKRGEFVNTWSVDAFIVESRSLSELGWGTHERSMPEDGVPPVKGSKVAMVLDRAGCDTEVRSWSPLRGPFHGMCMCHTESLSIASYLSVRDQNDDLVYRPSVMFAYRPCDDAMLSLLEAKDSEYQIDAKEETIMSVDEIVDGVDELGVMLCGNKKGVYWYGSQLSSKRAGELVEDNQATSLQVTATAIAGVMWVLQNPRRGVVEPDELPHREILDVIEPYVSPLVGVYSKWNPLYGNSDQWASRDVDKSDPWQFKNFLKA